MRVLFCMVVLFLLFKEPSMLLSIVAVPSHIPTNSAQGCPFLYILADSYLLAFDDSHLKECEVTPHHSFGLHFPYDY